MGGLNWDAENLSQYYIYRGLMGNGDLVEFTTYSRIGSMIRGITKKDVNHTGIVWCVQEFEDIKDRRFVMEALSRGIEINLLSDRLKNYKGSVYWHSLKKEFDEYRDKIASICLLAEGRTEEIRYDYISLIKNMYKKVNVDVSKYSFCSEFVQWVLEEAGVLEKQETALRPGEFDSLNIYKPRIQIYSWKD